MKMNRPNFWMMAGVAATAITAGQSAFAQADSGLKPIEMAQASPQTTTPAPKKQTVAAASAEEIVVFGKGQTKQVSAVTRVEMDKAIAGTNAIKQLQSLPGVNFQSADAIGSYEWSQRITLRGFGQSQLGFTLDGIPLGDMSYVNTSGLYIGRAIITENVGLIEVSQGSGSVGTPSTSNLGGAIKFTSSEPAENFGGTLAFTGGSDSFKRGYIRVDSGILPTTNTRLTFSYANQDNENWKGGGEQKQEQFYLKFVQPIAKATLTGFVDFSDRHEQDYLDLSPYIISKVGLSWDYPRHDATYFKFLSGLANQYWNGTFSIPNTPPFNPKNNLDDQYYDGSGLRRDTLAGLDFKMPITNDLDIDFTPYYHTNIGQGEWATPYVSSLSKAEALSGGVDNPAPITIRGSDYDLQRYGATFAATWTFGAHKINAGTWLERVRSINRRNFYGYTADGSNRNTLDYQRDPIVPNMPVLLAEAAAGKLNNDLEKLYTWVLGKPDIFRAGYWTNTQQFFIGDSFTFNDKLTINAGVKALTSKNTGHTYFGNYASGTLEAKDNFLPQGGANYKVDDNNEVFASVSDNMRTFTASTFIGPFQTSQAAFDLLKTRIKPETSTDYEAGWRFRGAKYDGVLSAYYIDFKNRLAGINAGSSILGGTGIYANVGSVIGQGFEASGTYHLTDSFSAYGSYSYNSSKYQDDVLTFDGKTVLAKSKDKFVVDSPEHIARVEFSYDDTKAFAKLGTGYMSRRYWSPANDLWVGGRTLLDLSAGYRFDGTGWERGFELTLNVSNITGKKYIATVCSVGCPFNAGGYQTALLAGAPRQVFVTIKKQF
jgi:iron complex outermembrane receptor protein